MEMAEMKKAIILVVALVACLLPLAFAAPGTMTWRNFTYYATVSGESNIIVTNLSTNFGTCIPNAWCTDLTNSLNVLNTGNQAPQTGINAAFTTTNTTTYGLISGANAIPGNNFWLNGTQLTSTAVPVQIIANTSIPAGANFNVTARLFIPAQQAAGAYSGIINLTWLN
jgi:hypothetical protein